MRTTAGENPSEDHDRGGLYLTITGIIQTICIVGLVLYVLRRDWENAFLTAVVVLLTLMPALLWRRYRILIPPEFQLVATVFVFLSIFLGSVRGYYDYWWWDVVLHTSSGFLLGIVGFLSVFLLNRTDRIPREMRPIFVCFFAVTFAVFLGVVWEIFEFACDRIWPSMDMQSQDTGVRDTMYDLIVDTLGAIVVAAMGWAYLRSGRFSFLADGIKHFLEKNPRLFSRAQRDAR
ncbi:MAG TPA: hypothetical protein VGR35_17055 [Tepidisphaeraceae bacterium]|nr:hypothetical protein [Tepidisphaeraceae bacterium]